MKNTVYLCSLKTRTTENNLSKFYIYLVIGKIPIVTIIQLFLDEDSGLEYERLKIFKNYTLYKRSFSLKLSSLDIINRACQEKYIEHINKNS